jgi:hypothetical protein
MKFIVAILDTMWTKTSCGVHLKAPPYFRINKQNFTGRRLYNLIGTGNSLVATNSCKELFSNAKEHGTPDPAWLSQNLRYLSLTRHIDVLLICGNVARDTWRDVLCFKETIQWFDPEHTRVVFMPHPAARTVWTREYTEEVKKRIQGA